MASRLDLCRQPTHIAGRLQEPFDAQDNDLYVEVNPPGNVLVSLPNASKYDIDVLCDKIQGGL
jgi:hypothetical protein